jgi:alkylhydroperoxidase family enzyme
VREGDGGEDKLAAVGSWRDSDRFSEAEAVALEYAERITITGERVDDALFARLRRHYSEAQIVELTLRITLCGFFNKFNDALQIKEEPEAVARLAVSGT